MNSVEVLVSAMNLSDISIISKTNISTNSVLINQCDREDFQIVDIENLKIKYFSTKERGLSNSRNKAIELATGDICLICDDDEFLYDDYEKTIIKAYSDLPDADIIVFKFNYPHKKYSNKIKKINYLNVSTISSVEISFKRERIYNLDIRFDKYFGSGAIYSSGEENKFLYDCLNKGLKIYYVPLEIGKLIEGGNSLWFSGFNQKYFFNKGAWLSACFPSFKYILVFYVVLRFRKLSELDILTTSSFLFKGIKAFKEKKSYEEITKHLKS